ncbi:hypothetical protein JCM16418A_42390 [Paenibacillus pini]
MNIASRAKYKKLNVRSGVDTFISLTIPHKLFSFKSRQSSKFNIDDFITACTKSDCYV